MSAEMITAIGAIIVGIAAVLNAILTNRKNTALLDQRLQNIETRLDTHNHYAESFSTASQKIAQIETDIAWIKTAVTATPKGDGGKK